MGKQNGKQIDDTVAYKADGDYDGDTVGQLGSTQAFLNAKSDPNFKLENFGKVGDDAYKKAQAVLGTHGMDGDYDGDTVGPKF